MFLFNFNSGSESKVERELTDEIVKDNYIEDKDYIIQSKYIISLDGEPISFTNTREEALDRVEMMTNKLKFSLVCENSRVYTDWNYDREECEVLSRDYNDLFGNVKRRHLISWKKITNNYP